ncbi:MAG: NAD-dependent epimerase/dehydratase family protein [Alphaproteobacteria bacterium]
MVPGGRFLVTGATGLIGRHVIEQLLDHDCDGVTAGYRTALPSAPDRRCDWRRADLADMEACAALVAGHDTVIHCAGEIAPATVLARDPVGPVRRNLAITGNIHEACWRAGVKKLVWFSSTTGYPTDTDDLDEADMFRGDPPDGWYGLGWAHRYLETQSRMYAEKLSPALDVVALRPSLVYGPRDRVDPVASHFVYTFVRRVLDREEPITVWGNGSQARDLIHARDVARAALLAVASAKGYAAYNIAAGTTCTTREVLELLLAIDGWTDARVRYEAPQGVSPVVTRRFLTARAEREIGFRPEVGLEQGLRELMAHTRLTTRELAL